MELLRILGLRRIPKRFSWTGLQGCERTQNREERAGRFRWAIFEIFLWLADLLIELPIYKVNRNILSRFNGC